MMRKKGISICCGPIPCSFVRLYIEQETLEKQAIKSWSDIKAYLICVDSDEVVKSNLKSEIAGVEISTFAF